jgi:thiol-disulfide isomerase/thioredoxin
MSGLLFLTSEDFNIQRGTKGDILCNGIQGFSLILFYSTYCTHCQSLIPIFKSLPGTINGCQFGIINVSQHRACIQMSKNTIAPITYVPYIVLYINGKPFMVYKGPYDANEIKRFILEVVNNLQKKQQFSRERIKENPQTKIPEYSIGNPLCGTSVCYLEFEKAYKDKVS